MVSSYVESYGIKSIRIVRNIVQIYERKFCISPTSQYSTRRKLCSCSTSYWGLSCLSATGWLLERCLECYNNFKWRISAFTACLCKTRVHLWWLTCSTQKFMWTFYSHYLLRSVSKRWPWKIRQVRNVHRSCEKCDSSQVNSLKHLTHAPLRAYYRGTL